MLNKSAWKGLVKEAYAAKNKSGLSEETVPLYLLHFFCLHIDSVRTFCKF